MPIEYEMMNVTRTSCTGKMEYSTLTPFNQKGLPHLVKKMMLEITCQKTIQKHNLAVKSNGATRGQWQIDQ